MGKVIDLTGQKFGRLTVLYRGVNLKPRVTRWVCQCDCGKIKTVTAGNLKAGTTVSCGCYRYDIRPRTHGMTRTRIYVIYNDIKMRCYQKQCRNYERYGGRGIKMCDEWLNDPSAFIKWAYENGYDENAPRGACTIDRIDVNGNYEPANCRWTDARTQANNRTNTVYLEYNGEKHSIAEWSRIVGIGRTTLRFRLQSGWSVERILTEPPKLLTHRKKVV